MPEQAATLAEVLKAAGYRTGGFIGAFVLGREYGFAQGFDEFDVQLHRFDVSMKLQAQCRWRRGRGRRERVDLQADQRLAVLRLGRPVRCARAVRRAATLRRNVSREACTDGEIAYVDACVARLVALLERQGRLDRTLVVAIADHGEGLGDHGEGEHGLFLYESVLRVPWIARLPGRAFAGTVVAEQVRSVDAMLTIADLLGVRLVERVDGASLVGVMKGEARREPPAAYAETFYPRLHYGWSELARSAPTGGNTSTHQRPSCTT